MTFFMGSNCRQCSAIRQQPNKNAGILQWLQPHLAGTLSSAMLFLIGTISVPAQLKNTPAFNIMSVGRINSKAHLMHTLSLGYSSPRRWKCRTEWALPDENGITGWLKLSLLYVVIHRRPCGPINADPNPSPIVRY